MKRMPRSQRSLALWTLPLGEFGGFIGRRDMRQESVELGYRQTP